MDQPLNAQQKTPTVLMVSRILFAVYFVATLPVWWLPYFPQTDLSFVWTAYLLSIYLVAEYLYYLFRGKGLDLSFAFPLLLAVYALNLVSMIIGAQESLPILNRAEHFTSFIMLTYFVWIFFTQYLPQDVWKKHPYYTSLLVLSVTSLFGVGNEVIELFLDVTFGTRTVGAGYDTSYDLVMNVLGAVLFLSVRLIYDIWENPEEHR